LSACYNCYVSRQFNQHLCLWFFVFGIGLKYGKKCLHNTGLKMRWAGHLASMGEGRNMYRVFGWKAQRKDQGVDGRMGSK
jgi:hypothetical protein